MDHSYPRCELPLVSIVITNYNYGRFLEDAVGSTLAQTYPHIECLIVDDASSDDSCHILDKIAQRWPNVKILRHAVNSGQTASFQTGFSASHGEYVVFLDADDQLLPHFVETHIFVHLSSRAPVGFTSSDMFQTRDSRIVTATWSLLSGFVASGRGLRDGLLRRIDEAAPALWPMPSAHLDGVESQVHLVETTEAWVGWVFAPTSGNCFRRDALDLVLRDCSLGDFKHHSDTLLNRGIGLLNGAIVIDKPLSIYRIHDQNGFVKQPELHGVCSADMTRAARADHHVFRVLVDRLIDAPGLFVEKLGPERYACALLTLQSAATRIPDFTDLPPLCGYIAEKLEASWSSVESRLGERVLRNLHSKLGSVRPERSEPRLKRLAELFLTLGRIFDAPSLARTGERLWRL